MTHDILLYIAEYYAEVARGLMIAAVILFALFTALEIHDRRKK